MKTTWIVLLGWVLPTAACSSAGAGTADNGAGDAGEAGPATVGPEEDAGAADAPGSDDASDAALSDAAEASDTLDARPDTIGDAAADGHAVSTVSGHVVAMAAGIFAGPNAPVIANRRVTLLDATGMKSVTMTDASGAFQMSGVTPPYDALVDADPNAPASASLPVAYLSIDTVHPRLLGLAAAERDAGADGSGLPAWRQTTLDVPLQLPACSTAACDIDVEVVDHTSGASMGSGMESYDNQHTTLTVPAWAEWYGADVNHLVDVYVLISDPAAAKYAYGAFTNGVLVLDKGTAQVPGPIAPAAVANIGTFTLNVSTASVPAAWGAPTLDVYLGFPGTQASARLASQVPSTSVAIEVPDVLGATLTAQAWSQDPDAGDPRSWMIAAASALPLTVGTEALTLPGPVGITAPAYGATISASTGVVSWTTAKSQVYVAEPVAASDAGSPTTEAYVFAGAGSMDLGHLTAMGVTLPFGPYDVLLSGIGKVASLDAILDESTLAVPDQSESVGIEWHCVIAP
ncbi:MAG TPA: hypothetical protein VF765_16350 [Polyangiaceae bacterium]